MSSFQVLNQITDTNGVTHDIQCIHRATMNTTTSTATAFVVDTSSPESVTNLYDGLTIVCKNTKIASASGCTLNLNGLGAKRIWLSQSNGYCTTHWALNQTYIFIYDETNERWELQQGRDTDSTTTNATQIQMNSNAIKCGTTAIVAGNIIVANSDGLYKHLKLGTAFDITYPILYAAKAIAASATSNDVYREINFTVTTTQSITLTAQKPVYIKGTLSGTTFTPVSTTPLTQTIPTTNDGYQYIYLGYGYSTTAVRLQVDHPIYAYKNGKFGLIANDASSVNGHTVEKDVPFSAEFDGGWQKYETTFNINNNLTIEKAITENMVDFYIAVFPKNNMKLWYSIYVPGYALSFSPYPSYEMEFRTGYYKTTSTHSYVSVGITGYPNNSNGMTFTLKDVWVNGTSYATSAEAILFYKYKQ